MLKALDEVDSKKLGGLTYLEARTRILKTLNDVSHELLQQVRAEQGSYPAIRAFCKLLRCGIGNQADNYVNHIIRQVYIILSVTATILAFYIASYEVDQAPFAPSGLLLSLIAIAVIGLTNALIIVLYKKSYDTEVYKSLQRITNQYAFYMRKQETHSNGKTSKKIAVDDSSSIGIPTGHSQISIINTLRNGQWQKLPILMLAEGDVIALMGGDLTPCKVVELISKKVPTKSSYSNLASFQDADWEEGEIIEKCCKIHIANGNENERLHHHHHHKSEYSYHREPSRSSRSEMTAIASTNSIKSVAMSSAGSFAVPERHRSVDPEGIEILRLCGNTRCFRVLETPMKEFIGTTYQDQSSIPMNRGGLFLHKLKREVQLESFRYGAILIGVLICISIIRIFVAPGMESKYAIDLLVPVATTIILLLPLSSPAFSVMVEAFGTAEVLTTLEVAHESDSSSTGSSRLDENAPDLSKASSTNGNNSGNNSPTINPMSNNGISKQQLPKSPDDEPSPSHNEFEDEEFIDEDLDARVEDIAEETATKVMYFRFFRYVLKVLYCRLFGGWSLNVQPISENAVKEEQPLLPIPLARTNIVGQLGAITMVCFVDDDIISENYSVTEEIFLLNENQEDSLEGINSKFGGNSANSSTRPPFNDQSVKHGPHSKVTVLDLHANPEATGSRFENPNWWKFLPCLKPLGFNALLTYKFTADNSNQTLSPGNLLALQENQSAKTTNTQNEDKSLELRTSADVEKALVRHIRKTLPLEFLRELAEEIGFVEDDLKNFTRALEVNVLAPGLENAHLLEDNHQWGQEESRRRGSLLPQLRGAVYRDTKGGSLQLMSLGDPSLILHYCREYWDGSTCSIIPLSPADRLEVLNVYERWRLEDFDVVAFSYSPMPVTQLQYLTEQVPAIPTSSRKRSASQAAAMITGEKPSNTAIFFVDPSSVQDLIGRKTRGKHHPENGAINSVPTGTDSPSIAEKSLNVGACSSMVPSHAVEAELMDGPSEKCKMVTQLPTIEDMDDEHEDHEEASPGRKVEKSHHLIKSSTLSHIGGEDLDSVRMLEREDSNSRGQDLSLISDVIGIDAIGSARRLSIGDSGRPVMKRSASDSNLVLKSSGAGCNAANSLLGLNSNSPKSSTPNLSLLDLKSSLNPTGGSGTSLKLPESNSQINLSCPVILNGGSDNGGCASANNINDASTMFYVQLDSSSGPSPLAQASPMDVSFSQMRVESRSCLSDLPGSIDDKSLSPIDMIRSPSFESGGVLSKTNSVGRKRASSHSDAISALAVPTVIDFSPQRSTLDAGSSSAKTIKSDPPAPMLQQPRSSLTRRSSNTVHISISAQTSSKGSKKSTAKTDPIAKKLKHTALRQLWSSMRQQIFLGMVASSVPVRKDVPNAKEDLDAAGIRFVYFSPQNMKRSKPVAEKIGIPFDWNCAISLRVLDSEQHDPHRHISNYADWDVLARMPHGIEAIKEHLKTVDNVPLLVSLFTDATPQTTQQMLEIFRDNGEVVLTIGAAYRAYNQNIYKTSNISCSIFTLPNVVSFVPAQEQDLLDQFPTFHHQGLTKSDLKLSFDLIGLGSINLLQAHSFYRDVNLKDSDNNKSVSNTEHLKLSVLLETIRKGRVLLLNEIQAIAFLVTCSIGLSLWPLLCNLVPISMPPSCPPPIAILLSMVYIPSIGLSMIFNEDHEGVMKNTPRKSSFTRRPRDESRFYVYLAIRALCIVFAIVITGIFTAASVFQGSRQGFTESLLHYHTIFKSNSTFEVVSDTRGFWLVQDMMSNAAVLAMLAQSFSLLARGQKFLDDFPWPRFYAEYYAVMVVILIVHGLVMIWRSSLRHCMMGEQATSMLVGSEYCDEEYMDDDSSHGSGGNASYLHLHFAVWIVLLSSSIGLNGVCGFVVNLYDRYHYRRYTQFLRLEFDTRLGMHSPR